MESKTKNRQTREQIARMLERAFGGATLSGGEDAVTELKEGWFNAAYSVRLSTGREAVLKIAPPTGAEVMQYEENIMATEVATMRMVREDPAIPVPEIFYFDQRHDLCDSDYYFMEKLTGDNYEHVKGSLTPDMRAQIDRQIGAIIKEVNSFKGLYFGYSGNSDLRAGTWRAAFLKIVDAVLEDGLAKDADFGHMVEEIRGTIQRHSATLDAVTEPCLVHWDAWDLNFFVEDGKVSGIIDFERAVWAEPLMEAQFRALDFGGVSDSMRGYGKTTFTPEEEIRCRLYTLHLGLVMKTECYFQNYSSDHISTFASQLIDSSLGWLKEH